MKSKSERISKSGFDRFLRTRHPEEPSWVWIDVAQTDEPPDYLLEFEGNTFMVEVTKFMTKLPVSWGHLPIAGVVGAFDSFVTSLEKKAKTQGILSGTYCLHFPHQIGNLRAVSAQIETEVIQFLKRTHDLPAAPQCDISQAGRTLCYIQKLNEPYDELVRSGPFVCRFEGEVDDELPTLLQERLAEKIDRLKDLKGDKILLLDDHYGFASFSQITKAASRLSDCHSFHTVAVIHAQTCQVIHTTKKEWRHANNDLQFTK